MEDIPEPFSPRHDGKKYLIAPKYSGDQVEWGGPSLKLTYIVIPEFIFHEKHLLGPDGIQKISGILSGIGRKVADNVCKRLFFPYFIPRWRVESQNDTVFRMLLPYSFNDWPSLLEFTQ
jgi:hypothetical protein